ncbi:hypothetical protein KM043_002103 [Ampulex compressa]|nr:hypothetical protein KM043_002103 [Ampulex compressa]
MLARTIRAALACDARFSVDVTQDECERAVSRRYVDGVSRAKTCPPLGSFPPAPLELLHVQRRLALRLKPRRLRIALCVFAMDVPGGNDFHKEGNIQIELRLPRLFLVKIRDALIWTRWSP